MKDFTLQLIFMCLGAFLPILLKSLYSAGSFWTLYYFFYDNLTRWIVEFSALVIIQTLLFFEGEFIIQGLAAFGVVVPVAAGSVVGFMLSIFVIKTIPTSAMAPPQNN